MRRQAAGAGLALVVHFSKPLRKRLALVKRCCMPAGAPCGGAKAEFIEVQGMEEFGSAPGDAEENGKAAEAAGEFGVEPAGASTRAEAVLAQEVAAAVAQLLRRRRLAGGGGIERMDWGGGGSVGAPRDESSQGYAVSSSIPGVVVALGRPPAR